MSLQRYDRGAAVTLTFTVLDEDEKPKDPLTVTLQVLAPDAEESTYTLAEAEVVKAETGLFTYTLTLDQAGAWAYRWSTTGNPTVAETGVLLVDADPFDDADDDPTTILWEPTVAEVAAHLHARTKTAGGEYAGVFNSETLPTDLQAQTLIGMAVNRVAASITAEPCTADLRRDARAAAALYAAMLVEQSYYPETTRANDSSFAALKSLWDGSIKTLEAAVAEECGGAGTGGTGGEGNSGAIARGHFSDGQYLIGRDWPEVW